MKNFIEADRRWNNLEAKMASLEWTIERRNQNPGLVAGFLATMARRRIDGMIPARASAAIALEVAIDEVIEGRGLMTGMLRETAREASSYDNLARRCRQAVTEGGDDVWTPLVCGLDGPSRRTIAGMLREICGIESRPSDDLNLTFKQCLGIVPYDANELIWRLASAMEARAHEFRCSAMLQRQKIARRLDQSVADATARLRDSLGVAPPDWMTMMD